MVCFGAVWCCLVLRDVLRGVLLGVVMVKYCIPRTSKLNSTGYLDALWSRPKRARRDFIVSIFATYNIKS